MIVWVTVSTVYAKRFDPDALNSHFSYSLNMDTKGISGQYFDVDCT